MEKRSQSWQRVFITLSHSAWLSVQVCLCERTSTSCCVILTALLVCVSCGAAINYTLAAVHLCTLYIRNTCLCPRLLELAPLPLSFSFPPLCSLFSFLFFPSLSITRVGVAVFSWGERLFEARGTSLYSAVCDFTLRLDICQPLISSLALLRSFSHGEHKSLREKHKCTV